MNRNQFSAEEQQAYQGGGARNLIIVKTKTRLEKLTENFNTVGQAMFNIKATACKLFWIF